MWNRAYNNGLTTHHNLQLLRVLTCLSFHEHVGATIKYICRKSINYVGSIRVSNVNIIYIMEFIITRFFKPLLFTCKWIINNSWALFRLKSIHHHLLPILSNESWFLEFVLCQHKVKNTYGSMSPHKFVRGSYNKILCIFFYQYNTILCIKLQFEF